MATRRLALSGIVFLLFAACNRRTQFDYYDFDFQKPLDVDQLVFRSSAIVVGVVRSVWTGSTGVPARRMPELLLDETFAEVEVENVILGKVSHPRLRLSYFAYSIRNRGGYSGPPPLRLEPGQRRILFLTIDSGQYRSVGDVRAEYSIRVWSGLHKDCCQAVDPGDYAARLAPQGQIGASISHVLLQLGAGYHREGMIQRLDMQAYLADRLAGRQASAAHLKRLAANEQEPGLTAKACLVLSRRYYGQSGCLAELKADAGVPKKIREEVAQETMAHAERTIRLKQNLRTFPLLAFSLSPAPDSIVGVREELLMLLDDPDPELRDLACAALRRNYPQPPEVCGSPPEDGGRIREEPPK